MLAVIYYAQEDQRPQDGDIEWRETTISVYETQITGGSYGLLRRGLAAIGSFFGGVMGGFTGETVGSVLEVTETTTYLVEYQAKQAYEYTHSPTYKSYENEYGQINIEQTSRGFWRRVGEAVPIRELGRQISGRSRQQTIQLK